MCHTHQLVCAPRPGASGRVEHVFGEVAGMLGEGRATAARSKTLPSSPQASSSAGSLEDRHGCARGSLEKNCRGRTQTRTLKNRRPADPRGRASALLTSAADARPPKTSRLLKGADDASRRPKNTKQRMEPDELEPPLPPPPPPQPIIEEEEGERMCRYCFDGEEEGELIAPCACKGGQRWVHLEVSEGGSAWF